MPREIAPDPRANFDVIDIRRFESDQSGNDGVDRLELVHSGQLANGVNVISLRNHGKEERRGYALDALGFVFACRIFSIAM